MPRVDKYVDSWRAMIQLRDEGLIRSIGVSNFTEANLDRLKDETGVVPVVNQIELNPVWDQSTMRDVDARDDIVTESWSPLGRGLPLRATQRSLTRRAITPKRPPKSCCDGTFSSAHSPFRRRRRSNISARTSTCSASSSRTRRWPSSQRSTNRPLVRTQKRTRSSEP